MWYCTCSDVMRTLCGARTQASWPPYVYMVRRELLMDVPFAQSEQYLSKITASHFSTLDTKFANWNVLNRILIAMHNENKANCNENFRICGEEPVAPLYNRKASIGLWGWRYHSHKFSSGPFWTHKIETKDKHISISNILHLLSAPASIPRVGAVLACLVVASRSNCKFIIVSNFCLIVDLCFHPSRALTRSLEAFTPSTWTYFCYYHIAKGTIAPTMQSIQSYQHYNKS